MKILALFGLVCVMMVGPLWADSLRPNIVLILCDDLGYSDVGFNGSPDITTPRLDELANSGMVFTSAYVPHPFCGPSRMGIFSGRYPHEFGAPYNLPADADCPHGIPVSETMFSTALQDAGYHTGAVGKWHMGVAPQFHPNRRGFDDYYGFLGGGHEYFPSKFVPIYERQKKAGRKIREYVRPLEHNGREVTETEYITDALSREASRLVKEAATKDNPFFLYLAYNAPHSPLQAKEEDMARFADITDNKRRTFAGMVYAVDRGVGRLVDTLKETGQFEDTLIIFLSDNGGKLSLGGTNAPLREGKGSVYEGGIRTPMFFHWPGKIAAGSTFEHLVTAIDFYPTLAKLAGATVDEHKHLDGKDLWPHLQAGTAPHADDAIFALRHRLGFSDVAARQGKWKAVHIYNQRWKLFDLQNDIGERVDLAASHPDIVKRLVETARKWSQSHTDVRWFHEPEAEANWKKHEMPNYEKDFQFDR